MSLPPAPPATPDAILEQVTIPPDRSFLWRIDNYPRQHGLWNYHPEIEIHLILHSSGICHIGDHIGNFDAGHLVLVGSNLPHDWVTPLQPHETLVGRDIVVQFDALRIGRAAEHLPELSKIGLLLQRAAFGVEFLGHTARLGAALIERMGQTKGMTQLALLFEVLALMANTRDYRTLATPQFLSRFRPGSALDRAALVTALTHIQASFRQGTSLSDIAALVGMSESAFSRFFKAQTGNTFSDHIANLRLWTARRLLADGTMPITAICFAAGFANISNFNRTFLARTGMTPSQFRRAAQQRGPDHDMDKGQAHPQDHLSR